MAQSSSVTGQIEEYPYLRVLPASQLLVTTFDTIAKSNSVQEFQLITAGKSLLKLLEDISPCQTNASTSSSIEKCGDVIEYEIKRLLAVFSAIFERLVCAEEKFKAIKQSDDNELPNFLTHVWDIHNKGTVKLMNTTVPSKILLLCPNRLDKLLKESLSSLDPIVIIPYCEKSKDLFMEIMYRLARKFLDKTEESSSGELQMDKSCLVEYAKQILYILQTSISPNEYLNFYPSEFHSILSIETWIADTNVKYFGNVEIAEHLFTITDVLIEKCVNTQHYNFLPFFIAIHNNLDVFLRQNLVNDEIRFKNWPYLWKFCKKYLT